MTRKTTQRGALLGALTLTLGLASVQAQPPAQPPAGNNGGGNNGGRPNFQNMTPEQRTAFFAQMQEQRTRGQLERYGITDKKIQDVIVAYVKAQETARQPIQEASRKVTDALSDRNIPDAQVFAAFATLRKLIDAEKARVATDQKTLDTLVGYSKNPRLGVVLTMMGLIGDESQYFGGGGRGGFGGGGFGGGGGRGGAPGGGAPGAPPAAN